MQKKFLIGQLACFGDCLYATTIAKQIKNDFPDSHITWAVANKYKSILLLNPHVDEIWEVEIINNDFYFNGWKNFQAEAQRRKANGIYDEIFFSQIAPDWKYYDGTIRSSTLKAYKRPITVSIEPVVRLSENEVANVKSFSDNHNLPAFKEVILFEYAPGSGQSFVNLNFALAVAENITATRDDVCFILSSPTALNHSNSAIIDASELTYRENAELTKYCTLLIGSSSGITWLATSDWAKKLNTLQLLNRDYDLFAGVKYDYEQWGVETTNVIEVTVNDVNYVTNCLKTILENDFQTAKQQYDEVYIPNYSNFRTLISQALNTWTSGRLKKVAAITLGFAKRNKHMRSKTLVAYAVLDSCKYFKESYRLRLKSKFRNVYARLFKKQTQA